MLYLQKKLFDFCPKDDKDLVHEFVQNDGLSCLIKVGAEADQNYQNYILRGSLVTFSSITFHSSMTH